MILVIDNYDSFTYNLVHLIGRRTSDLLVVRNDAITVEQVRKMAPDGILISPGPGRPADAGITEELIRELGADQPVLGVCLGHQAIGEVFGGRIVHAPSLMHGKTSRIRYTEQNDLFRDVEQDFTATRYHSLVVDRDTLPDELVVTAETPEQVVMGVRHKTLPIHGIQFHPESVLTIEGPRLIDNWLQMVRHFVRPSIAA